MSLLQLWCVAVTPGGAEPVGQDSPSVNVPQPRTYDKIKKIISSYVKNDKSGAPATYASYEDPSFQESGPANQHPDYFTNPAYTVPVHFPNPSHGMPIAPPPQPTAPSYGPGGYPADPSYASGGYPAAPSYGFVGYPAAPFYGVGGYPAAPFYGLGGYPSAPYGSGGYRPAYASMYRRGPMYGTSNHFYRMVNPRNYVRTPLYNLQMSFPGDVPPTYQVAPRQRYGF